MKMQIVGSRLSLSASETLGVGPAVSGSPSPAGDHDACASGKTELSARTY